MNQLISRLPMEEKIPLYLRQLYEKWGYQKYTMGNFEPYEMYMENKNFLKTEGIITFTDNKGRLIALKPDVTMSIVKNTLANQEVRKLYYDENVYRRDEADGIYKEINQVGVEFVGAEGVYSEVEILELATRSLITIGKDYVITISYMSLIIELLQETNLKESKKTKLMEAIKQKSRHEIKRLGEEFGLDSLTIEDFCEIGLLNGSFQEVLPCLKSLLARKERSEKLDRTVYKLEELFGLLKVLELDEKIILDFSYMNSSDYYNGLIFAGYVKGVTRPVLVGGRYDKLFGRFGKKQKAVGFAIYLEELKRHLHQKKEYDVETLLLYKNTSAEILALKAKNMRDKYSSLLTQPWIEKCEDKGIETYGLSVKNVFLIDGEDVIELNSKTLDYVESLKEDNEVRYNA